MTASIHFQTDHDDDVYELLAGEEAFVSPPILGWVSVFDRQGDDGDLERLADLAVRIGGALECPALVMVTHDIDVFFYLLFENGDLADEYASEPDFFGELPPGERQSLAGDASVLIRYAIPGATKEDLRAVLDDETYEAGERCARLGKLLGIENTQYGYDALQRIIDRDEPSTVVGWDLFMQSPPVDDEESEEEDAGPSLNGHISH